MNFDISVGDWLWSLDHRQPCKVVEVTRLWDDVIYHVWLSSADSVVRTSAERLGRLEEVGVSSPEQIRFTLFGARIANLLNEDLLLAPVGAAVIPLPHQLRALRRATSQDRVRCLLADEVGLGKTIEAGLILRELKLRGLARRILVLAPKGLVTQWVAEMSTHFGEEFRHFAPGDFGAYRRIAPSENVWRSFDQVICSVDSVKPLDARKGWSVEQVARFNQDRFEGLVTAGWDLIIVDEAHRLGGSTEQVARYQLGRGLAEASPYLLLLSATPHQGKTDAFHRLIALLDPTAFPDAASVTRERVQPYVIRTEKRHAINAEGNPLFKPRVTRLVGVSWGDEHGEQRQLYEAVTGYVREGYNQAIREKKRHVGFLMILMQRLVTSSTRAIATTLERRLDALQTSGMAPVSAPVVSEEEWEEMDAQEQLDTLMQTRTAALQNERGEVGRLLDLTRKVEARGPDAKAEALLEWIYRFQQEESDPDLKALVFTEFVPTQAMLAEFLRQRGMTVVCLNGSMSMEERRTVQQQFAGEARVLVSTDAGGEGLNLQFCHLVVNFDLPWNPMRIEQRIGRVDRIGQGEVVRAINFVLEDTVEFRVREVLESKLAVILAEFGIDKTGDVLDSAEAAEIFDGLYIETLLRPDGLDASLMKVTDTLRHRAGDSQARNQVIAESEALDPWEARTAAELPLNDWLVRMTENYVAAHGGRTESELDRFRVTWPGEKEEQVFFSAGTGAGETLTLDHPRVQAMLTRLPKLVEGMPIPVVQMPGLPAGIAGLWSLWEVGLRTTERWRGTILPLFVHDDGRVLVPTARFLWEQLCMEPWRLIAPEPGRKPESQVFGRLRDQAMQHGRTAFEGLRLKHRRAVEADRERGDYSFRARRRILSGVGLPEVRAFRLRQLAEEEDRWRRELARRGEAVPGLTPVLILRFPGTSSPP